MIVLVKAFVTTHRSSIQAFLSMIGGSVGRLLVSLLYFITIANTLSVSDFGLFATASACGIMLSRLLAFGFVSPLYRIATVKQRLLGTYTAGFMAGLIVSLPLIGVAAWVTYRFVFANDLQMLPFATLILAEVLCWRIMEIVIIVSNGISRFAAGALLVVLATSIKTVAAVLFAWLGDGSLAQWSWFYIAANAISAVVAVVFFYPKVRLRWKPALYLRRWTDAVSVAGAEMLFYIQSELDKVLVLSLGGAETAGIYAIIMRLVDLTALPVRAFMTLFVQRLMRTSEILNSLKNRILLEAIVAIVSIAGLVGMSLFLWFFPNGLGKNVSQAAPLLILLLFVPALRNLLEYHSELLYATGRTVRRMIVLALLGGMKALLLAFVLNLHLSLELWIKLLNAVFVVLYLQSAVLTYPALRNLEKRPI